MCRRNRLIVAMALAAGLGTAAASADPVAAYLERHGLERLLAVHLEEQLGELAAPQRKTQALRLAAIYARLLESAEDPVRSDLEGRSRRLLSTVGPDAGAELRLALLRGKYRTAEKIAENHRLRQSTEAAVDRAKATLTEIIPELRRLRGRLEERVRLTERRLMRASGGDAALLAEQAERSQRQHDQGAFLGAWALYYQSWLHERAENARVAEDLFGQLLAPDSTRPQPNEVSVDLRSVEAVARSILGMALCKSLTASSATAIKWIELLEDERAYPALREQVPAWKIVIHLEHREYRQAQAILTARTASGEPPPLAWLRLAAVHALERAAARARSGQALRRARPRERGVRLPLRERRATLPARPGDARQRASDGR